MTRKKTANNDKETVTKLLQLAGITINGPNPWDIRINDDRIYSTLVREGSLGLGESYMAGWWDCEQVDELITRLVQTNLENHVKKNRKFLLQMMLGRFINYQNRKRALEVGRIHYDIDPDLYRRMLDAEMNYSCGYWRNARTLDEAQKAKLELSCRKLELKPGMRVLDIGCGFGAFAKYAAKNYLVEVVGITISEQQALWATENCRGYPVEIRFQDYRDVAEQFDRVVSIGMFEHVGKKNYRDYMGAVFNNLVDGGLFLLHTIGTTSTNGGVDAWVTKYIFPNAALPVADEIPRSAAEKFIIEDWHNLGGDYIKTLKAWQRNFTHHWSTIRQRYDDRFFRMWNYYLSAFMGSFRARKIQIWQVVLSKNYLNKDYMPVR